MRGGYSADLSRMRNKLVELASLLELELDFAEEDVEFAERAALKESVEELKNHISKLLDSFALGNAIKEGICVAIAGAPNAGKSTLLNRLLNEERAMVSEIPGTTRDAIEEKISFGGIGFRFVDTAGLRETEDTLERMGIERTYAAIARARILLYIVDASSLDIDAIAKKAKDDLNSITYSSIIVILNKIDLRTTPLTPAELISLKEELNCDVMELSAKRGDNMEHLVSLLIASVDMESLYGGDTILSNGRHYEALTKALESIKRVKNGLSTNISGDFIAQDIRECMHYLGEITGEITTDEVLGNIFKNFCVGK
jgi:tRNA modification GTPase